jgi:subtilase family serine protease
MIGRPSFKLQGRSNPNSTHEVVVFVHQRNIDVLHDMLTDRSSPNSPNYQKWLTHEEVQNLTCDHEAFGHVISWLENNNMKITWTSSQKDYIKVSGSIRAWETLLETEFYSWKDEGQLDGKIRYLDRAYNYTIPDALANDIFDIIMVTQVPPIIKHYSQTIKHKKSSNWKKTENDVDPNFLKSLYEISSTTGIIFTLYLPTNI